MTDARTGSADRFEQQRERIRARYLAPPATRPASSARGLHHTALVSSDVERTVEFYQGLLEFPLTEVIENRDYAGSSHFFFDIGNRRSSTFPASTWGRIARSSGDCTTSRSVWNPCDGIACETSWSTRVWTCSNTTRCRSTSGTPTEHDSN